MLVLNKEDRVSANISEEDVQPALFIQGLLAYAGNCLLISCVGLKNGNLDTWVRCLNSILQFRKVISVIIQEV